MAKKIKNKEPPYALIYGLSIIISLILHYFFLSELNINSTINVALAFLLFTVVVSIIVWIFER